MILGAAELHNLYPSSNSIQATKLKEVRWAGHVACMGETKKYVSDLARNLKGRNELDFWA
jgi:hypothetical protein